MKHLVESINEASWRSCNGSYTAAQAEALMKDAKLPSIKKAYVALDAFDYDFGGPIEWEVVGKDNDIFFINPDAEKEWKYDKFNEEWNEVKYGSHKK